MFNSRYLCSSCSPVVAQRTCIHLIDLSRMFVPHCRDFLKNLGDFTGFYRTSLIVPSPPPLPPYRASHQGGEFLSHQAGKGKANFQEPGLGNFQEEEDDFRKLSRKLLFYMDYLLITDFQKFFLYNEFPLKLYNFFFILLYFSFFKCLHTSDILCYCPSENSFHVSPF